MIYDGNCDFGLSLNIRVLIFVDIVFHIRCWLLGSGLEKYSRVSQNLAVDRRK